MNVARLSQLFALICIQCYDKVLPTRFPEMLLCAYVMAFSLLSMLPQKNHNLPKLLPRSPFYTILQEHNEPFSFLTLIKNDCAVVVPSLHNYDKSLIVAKPKFDPLLLLSLNSLSNVSLCIK